MRRYGCLFPVFLLCGGAATAQQTESPDYFFDCDAPAGYAKDWSRAIAAKSIRVQGAFELGESRKDPQWLPIANIWFMGSSEPGQVGLKAFVAPRAPTELQMMLDGPESLVKGTGVISLKWKGAKIPFLLLLNDSGEFSAVVGDRGYTSLPLGSFTASGVVLSCSTGHFHFAAQITTVDALPTHTYEVGQVWTYHVREGDEGSTLQINRIDQDPNHGTIFYITVFGVKVIAHGRATGITEFNVPVSSVTLDKSVISLSTDQVRPISHDTGYEVWKKAFASGNTRPYTYSVAELVAKAQESLEKPEK